MNSAAHSATVPFAAATPAEPRTPVPLDDSYTINGVIGMPISEVFDVLVNDLPGSGLRITQLTHVSPPLYGFVSFTQSSISYQVERYDGKKVTDYFK